MNKFTPKLPNDVTSILQMLKNNNKEAFVVGGCVRDTIINRPIHDWDMTSNATPDEIKHIFNHTLDTGIAHGTVTVMLNNTGYEITTYRTDGTYSDNRHPDAIAFTSDINEDLKRRDFTMNAIAYNPWQGFVDPYHGIDDINNKTIRAVGCANDRFNEDSLRILRAIRFSAKLGFRLDDEVTQAINSKYNLLSNVSKERFTKELLQIAETDNYGEILLHYPHVFATHIPVINDMVGFSQNNPYHIYDLWEHTCKACSNLPTDANINVKLATLFHDIGKVSTCSEDDNGIKHFYGHANVSAELADNLLHDLKIDNKTRKQAVTLIKYHDTDLQPTPKCIKNWLNKVGYDTFNDLITVQIADKSAQNIQFSQQHINNLIAVKNQLDDIVATTPCVTLKDLKINGNDLMKIGIPQGKAIGTILNTLLNQVINDEVRNDHDELIAKALSNQTKRHNIPDFDIEPNDIEDDVEFN